MEWLNCIVPGNICIRRSHAIKLDCMLYDPLLYLNPICSSPYYVYLASLSLRPGIAPRPFLAGRIVFLSLAMQDSRHISGQNCMYGVPQTYPTHTIQNNSTQTTPLPSDSMMDLLRGPISDTRYSDHGYQHRPAPRSALDHGVYVADCSQNFCAQSELSPQLPILWSPFEHVDPNKTQSCPYTPEFFGSAPMWSKVSAYRSLLIPYAEDAIHKVSLRHATQQDLLAAQNTAYMQLFTQNININAHLVQLQ